MERCLPYTAVHKPTSNNVSTSTQLYLPAHGSVAHTVSTCTQPCPFAHSSTYSTQLYLPTTTHTYLGQRDPLEVYETNQRVTHHLALRQRKVHPFVVTLVPAWLGRFPIAADDQENSGSGKPPDHQGDSVAVCG